MPKYLYMESYTADGAKGLLKDGGSKRAAVLEQVVKGLGGTVEAVYYAFGETDVFAIVDLPDHASTAAVSLAVVSNGIARMKTVVLLTPAEMDEAAKKTVGYRPPEP